MVRLRRTFASAALGVAVLSSCAILGAPTTASAQAKPKTTTGLIQRAAELYDDQQYEESVQTLSAALVRPGNTKQEKVEIYRLLAFNYISLKKNDEADAAVRGLLVVDESYELAKTESPRFRDFFQSTRKKWEAEGKPGKSETPVEGADKAVVLKHTSPSHTPPNVAIKLSGQLEDPDGRVRGIQLAYRTGAKGKFELVAATYSLGQFRVQIPSSAVKPPLVEYYFEAVDKGGLPVASKGDAANPLRIAVEGGGGGVLTSPGFWVPVTILLVGGAVATGVILSLQTQNATVNVRVKE